tara:strand:+ start:1177 stop:2175 length:999 start_codon:yes stop_codon:yes gene_type:complete
MKNSILLFMLSVFLISSCVSPKIHNNLISDYEKNQKNLNEKEKENLYFADKLEELNSKISSLKEKISQLKNDSIQNGNSLITLQNKYTKLSTAYDLLASQNSRQMSEKAKETKRLLDQLEESQNNLLTKEDELNKLSKNLSEKEKQLNKAKKILEERSAKVNELEKIINNKDSLVTSIKRKVQKALIGLEGDGLTIEQRNGKIYISLEENLLFASGKYMINQSGLNALNKLSEALANQSNLKILVEGHTDNVQASDKAMIKDNWDLSVMRATSVVKILLNNKKLDPLQLTAAGRGEYSPIATNETVEGRKMNRRIDMILSPNLDDLYKILEE